VKKKYSSSKTFSRYSSICPYEQFVSRDQRNVKIVSRDVRPWNNIDQRVEPPNTHNLVLEICMNDTNFFRDRQTNHRVLMVFLSKCNRNNAQQSDCGPRPKPNQIRMQPSSSLEYQVLESGMVHSAGVPYAFILTSRSP